MMHFRISLTLSVRFLAAMVLVGWASAASHADDVSIESLFPSVELAPLYGGASEPIVQAGQLTYVDLWASWCGPCAKTLPELSALAKTYNADDVRFVMVTVDEDETKARRFAHRLGVKSNQYIDPEAGLMTALGAPGLPTGYLVDANGRVRLVHVGGRPNSISFLKAHIDRLLAEQRFDAFLAATEINGDANNN